MLRYKIRDPVILLLSSPLLFLVLIFLHSKAIISSLCLAIRFVFFFIPLHLCFRCFPLPLASRPDKKKTFGGGT
jgi:uncharacterized membrane protein